MEVVMNKLFICIFVYIIGNLILASTGNVFADTLKTGTDKSGQKVAKTTFAGGCFWCMQHPFDKLGGVISTTVGYTGGTEKNPTYKGVSAGKTGHAEAVEITYDPLKITYPQLLDIFWRNINPTQVNGQFFDIGRQYRTAIFYHNKEQEKLALDSKEKLENSDRYDKKIVTEIVPATDFYRAEDYHQDYYKKNPIRYKYYRIGSGRDRYLEDVWGKKQSK